MFQVTFAEFANVVQAAASSVDAAEGHGCLCGALCTAGDYTMERWLEELIPDEARTMGAGDAEVLRLVYEDTLRALRGEEMIFEPLLPEDDEALERRATLMSQWARGFLYGFGTGGQLPEGAIAANVDEVLRDMVQIGGAAIDVGAAGEEEEAAYTEVFEYLRVGVQLIHDELQVVREADRVAHGARKRQFTDADDGGFDRDLDDAGDDAGHADEFGEDPLH